MKAHTRLGLFGGTFDPVHYGHLDAAEKARSAVHLDEVLLIPAHDPPHKPADPHASDYHRFALVGLAINEREGLRASDMEMRRKGPSYTAATLRDLHQAGWRPLQLFFIIGADAFADIASWHDFPNVLDACNYVVMARPGTTVQEALSRTPRLRERARRPGEPAIDSSKTAIFLVEAETRPVTSTDLRQRLAKGQSIDGLVPPAVERHIRVHHLYGAVDDLHGKD
jgi:nicotinate-nucleotide adenylyltransferase